ncbi:hypothetical protein HU200_063315 [Digitaria exilis]|uniref:Uncharacterized protein n=1 Tax=Digitaria exilis TaxID=1010633 RepID=A0A835A214_9POAL|nr:hypothetical protein HU200_063315 [Digitaria exilis]
MQLDVLGQVFLEIAAFYLNLASRVSPGRPPRRVGDSASNAAAVSFWAAASFLMPLVGATPLLFLLGISTRRCSSASPYGTTMDSRITGGAFSVPAASPTSIRMMFSVASIALYNRFLGRAQAFTPLQLMRLGHATVALAACAQAGERQGWRGAHGH